MQAVPAFAMAVRKPPKLPKRSIPEKLSPQTYSTNVGDTYWLPATMLLRLLPTTALITAEPTSRPYPYPSPAENQKVEKHKTACKTVRKTTKNHISRKAEATDKYRTIRKAQKMRIVHTSKSRKTEKAAATSSNSARKTSTEKFDTRSKMQHAETLNKVWTS